MCVGVNGGRCVRVEGGGCVRVEGGRCEGGGWEMC